MNDAKGGHTHGRKEEGGTDSSAPFTFFALCLAVALFTVLQVTPIAGHAQAAAALQFPWHYTAAAESIPPPHPRAPHVACESFGSERQVREDNRIRHRYKTNRKEEEDFTERKEGGMDGGRVGGRGRRCRAHRPFTLGTAGDPRRRP